jgi:hypothetical protein
MNFLSYHDLIYFVSIVLWSALLLLSIIVFYELRSKSMQAQSHIVWFLILNTVCRLGYFILENAIFGTAFTQAILNRLAALFQFTAVTIVIYFWCRTLSTLSPKVIKIYFFVVNMCMWVFICVTTFICFRSRCAWFYVGLSTLALINIGIMVIMLGYGEYTTKKLKNIVDKNVLVNDSIRYQLKCAEELRVMCIAIGLCFLLRALSYAFHPTPEPFYPWASWHFMTYLYPYSFYQVGPNQ